MAQLKIIASNDQPERQSNFPETWLLHKDNNTIEIHVTHDRLERPFVRAKAGSRQEYDEPGMLCCLL
ncbi:MAG: hypothetical protein JO159_16215 [Acidobacteria bacterium]|nr:hypothetical protein [Acidobacteriota bacterium]